MEIMEIISDALVYPLNNLKAFVIYLVLGIIAGIAIAGTVSAIVVGVAYKNALAIIGSGILGIIVTLIIGFVITGYELDIIKYGIERNVRAPGIDFVRQFINGIKFFVVNIVYFIVPIIIGSILAIIFQHWLSGLLTAILFIIFALAAIMGQCRLAKTEDLVNALAIGEAIGDISRVGILKLILFIVVVFVIALILSLIVSFINNWNTAVGGVLIGILGVYLTFFTSRAMGLLYSDV
ncbi:DUF4013 domain-containing protein [Methanobrevibacter sp.]|uniref:DUF4013 domain-containing protein n=1 Tax=Methanobrevibacter sp. TaxID=66852 RepID=UPI0026E06AF1|nr:DUF4013 domain-containing protein [Methanobrevibacter sp.]MDO5860693.1 DUF4013 domain-containing protein [Methanobrevibacter sp.]